MVNVLTKNELPYILTYSNTFLIECVGNQNIYLLLTITNNNTAQGRLWNCSSTSGNPSGIHLVDVDRN